MKQGIDIFDFPSRLERAGSTVEALARLIAVDQAGAP